MVPQKYELEVLEKLWVWAKELEVYSKEFKEKLIAKDKNGFIAWHRAALFGRLQALETFWSLTLKAELNPHELLLAKFRLSQDF